MNGQARRDYARLEYRPIETKPLGFEYRSAPAAIIQTPRFFALCARIIGRLTECYTSGDVIEVNDTPDFEELPASIFPRRDEDSIVFGLAYRLRQCEDAENANALREHLTIIREQIERRF